MSSPVTPITTAQLTDATLAGSGVFDTLMRANKAHLEAEFKAGRIKGADYASVYLSSLQSVLAASVQFLLGRDTATLAAEKTKAEIALVEAQKSLVDQQLLNAVTENTVLVAQECKLRAEYDATLEQKARTAAETSLINQKLLTERAQTQAVGVDQDSVVGRQKNLYKAQADGFSRDAEQKAADLLIRTWATRRTTDEGTVADATNMLNDATIGRAVNKMLAGISA